jgi:hypothetical protein
MLDVAPILALEEYLQRWTALRTTCVPADRKTADEGIRLAYQAAGLSPPFGVAARSKLRSCWRL